MKIKIDLLRILTEMLGRKPGNDADILIEYFVNIEKSHKLQVAKLKDKLSFQDGLVKMAKDHAIQYSQLHQKLKYTLKQNKKLHDENENNNKEIKKLNKRIDKYKKYINKRLKKVIKLKKKNIKKVNIKGKK